MGRLVKRPLNLLINKTWANIEKELIEYLRNWAGTYPKGFEEIAELIRARVGIKVSDGSIFDESGRINSLYVYVEGYDPGPIIFCIEERNLRDILKMIKESEKENT